MVAADVGVGLTYRGSLPTPDKPLIRTVGKLLTGTPPCVQNTMRGLRKLP